MVGNTKKKSGWDNKKQRDAKEGERKKQENSLLSFV
jgi:hypothetical protein